MRLFPLVDGVIDRFDRAGLGMTRPFDLALRSIQELFITPGADGGLAITPGRDGGLVISPSGEGGLSITPG